MKYFHIDSKIDKELLNKFFDFCNLNGEEDWSIVLYTVGGWTVMAKNILHVINKRHERVTLICNEAYSAGFDILYNAKCKKVLCENAKGMVHMSAAEMYMQSNGRPSYSEDECIVKNWKQSKKDYLFVRKFLTKNEIKKFKKGKDIYFTFKRMKEIFPDAEII